MQKFRARKNCSWLTQPLLSTSSCCMMAICPAGPPKLIRPSLDQNRSASLKLTKGGTVDTPLTIPRTGTREPRFTPRGSDFRSSIPAPGEKGTPARPRPRAGLTRIFHETIYCGSHLLARTPESDILVLDIPTSMPAP